MRHIIQKQVFELALGPGVEAFGTQHAASRFFRDILLPLLERAFDELAGEGVVIRVDRLVLDLGVLSEQQLSLNFPEQELYALLLSQLRQMMQGEKDGLAARLPSRVSIFEQWWYYMEKGRLPWNTVVVDADWYRSVLETLSVDYQAAGRLSRALEERPAFRKRVSLQHPDAFLETLTGILIGVKQEALIRRIDETCILAGWLEKSGSQAASELSDTNIRQMTAPQIRIAQSLRQWVKEHHRFLSRREEERKAAIWELVLQEAARRPMKKEGVIPGLIRWLSEDEQIHRLLRDAWPDIPLLHVMSVQRSPTPTLTTPEITDPGTKEMNTAHAAPLKTNDPELPGPPAVQQSVREQALADRRRSGAGVDGEDTAGKAEDARVFDLNRLDEDGLFGPCAGLILLHPFLTTFFTHCDLYGKDGFAGMQARQQATFLLYYLATGEKEAPEHELLFPKMFCGCDPEEPFPIKLEVAESNYVEADELLGMVLQRWEKLHHSSVTALREGFLQRKGKLVNRGDRLLLLMEGSAIDVLLDYLPWNLGIAKLPWMKELIYVEWR